MPALFSWGDVDGDGRLDLAAVSRDGKLQVLANTSDGRFEDVTERVGLFDVGNAAVALWADYDGDGRLDLFVGAREGGSRLFHNDYGVFIDVSARSGVSSKGAVQSAEWLDEDGDGRLDLFVGTTEKSELFRGLPGGFFVATELPSALSMRSPGAAGTDAGSLISAPPEGAVGEVSDPGTTRDRPRGRRDLGGSQPPGGSSNVVSRHTTQIGSHFRAPPPTPGCEPSITDQAVPANCLLASTTPTLGRLYPISSNLFVTTGGNVGIGTTSPTAKLHVAGTARMTDTLTLSPSGDQALNVSTGSIYKGGALFIHTKGGIGNTALGGGALSNVGTGRYNTASGYAALLTNVTGDDNTASGFSALGSNGAGSNNTASGYAALASNSSGNNNTASGFKALYSNTTSSNTANGYEALQSNTTGNSNNAFGVQALQTNIGGSANTAIGVQALSSNTTGSFNTALGHLAGQNLTTGHFNIAIGNNGVAGEGATIRLGTAGTQTKAFIAGIRGVTTVNANAIPVLVDSSGQLGTVSSSCRFKKDIADMGDLTDRLLELRPVVFHYKQEQKLPNGAEVPLEYGLIAEEVAEIFPDLVVYDEGGKPFTVKYHILSSMLLNELKKMSARLESQSDAHTHEMEELRNRLASIESRIPSAAVPAAIPAGGR